MEIEGVIEEVIDKSNPPIKKKVVIIKDTATNKSWCIEFRKQLYESISILRLGDFVKVKFYNEGRIDEFNNCYNNIIAEKIERIQ